MAIQVRGVSKSFGERVVLDRVDLYLGQRERAGLIGPNGCGKTTLLRIIAGLEEKDSGAVDLPRDEFVLGYLEQFTRVVPGATLLEEALRGAEKIRQMESRMRLLEERMASGDESDVTKAAEEYSRVLARFEHSGGYTFETEVKSILTGLGFREHDWTKPAEGLSGGERTRLALARLLAEKPDFILLDEPTNHLDLPAIEWLESNLRAFDGGYLIVSHDRRFLDACCPVLFEIEGGRIFRYTGGYEGFLEQKAERLEREQKVLERRQEEIARLREFVARWSKDKRRASQAMSRKRRLEKLAAEPLEVSRREKAGMSLRFDESVQSFDEVVSVRNLSKQFGSLRLFCNLTFSVRRGERLAIIGRNGSGKTTLLRMMTGEVQPDSGEIWWGERTIWAYFSQTMEELEDQNSAIHELMRLGRGISGQEARNLLGRFLFSGDDIEKRVGDLSGGEKSKLMLAILLTRKPNCLVLDEPTNHLDLPSREVLEEALMDFPGTLIFVSHDRAFIDRLATHTLELRDGEARMYAGNYTDMLYRQEEMRRLQEEAERKRKREQLEEERREKARQKRRRSKAAGEVPSEPDRLMDQIELLEAQIASLEEELALPEVYLDHVRSAEISRALKSRKAELDALYKRLEESLNTE